MLIDLERSMQRCRMRTVKALRSSTDDTKKLQKTLEAISKQMGDGVLSPIAHLADRHDVQCTTTGWQVIDDIISGRTERVNGGARKFVKGAGRGVPRGRIIELWGPESSGKTTFALALVKSFQERGLLCAYIDAEQMVDIDYADDIGCDTESWLYSSGGDTAEETLEMVDKLVRDEVVDLIVIDSVAALTPKAELDGEVGEHHVGLHARLMSQALRKINRRLRRGHRCTVLFINQTRSKIGVRFGDPETTTGGNALKFYASVRMRISSMGAIKKGGEKGQRSKIKVRKTKVGVPFGECFIEITGGNGITAAFASDPRGADDKGGNDGDDD